MTIYLYIHEYVCIHIIYICMYICIYIYICMYICIYAFDLNWELIHRIRNENKQIRSSIATRKKGPQMVIHIISIEMLIVFKKIWIRYQKLQAWIPTCRRGARQMCSCHSVLNDWHDICLDDNFIKHNTNQIFKCWSIHSDLQEGNATAIRNSCFHSGVTFYLFGWWWHCK